MDANDAIQLPATDDQIGGPVHVLAERTAAPHRKVV